jgi:anti-sigma regulatory factor (Ser/Thr protein kinase)
VGRDELVASAAYQPEPTAAAAARRFVRDTLQSWVVTGDAGDGRGVVDDAVLLTSELVTNAVVHAGTPVQVTCKLASGEVEVVVSDCHPARLVPEPAEGEHGAAERTSGRGLLLPAALASAWGVTYGPSAKAVWFRLGLTGQAHWGGDLNAGLGEFEAGLAGGATLAAAFRSARVAAPGTTAPPERGGITTTHAGRGYPGLLAAVAESARAAVGADGSFVLMSEEDGDLRLQATAGVLPPAMDLAGAGEAAPGRGAPGRGAAPGREAAPGHGPGTQARGPLTTAPSVLTVPFIVDGRVTGLLAVVSARPGRFGDTEAAKLERLADSCGPRLQRAWMDELQRARRDRIAALAQARGLLTGQLGQDQVMALVGGAVVPALAPWCAVLLPREDGGQRPVFVRHQDEAGAEHLTALLQHACHAAPPVAPARQAADHGPGWRWRLPLPPGGEPPQETGVAWCFPVGPGQERGLLVIGAGRGGRLSREVAALASDVACRVGFALAGSGGLISARRS